MPNVNTMGIFLTHYLIRLVEIVNTPLGERMMLWL